MGRQKLQAKPESLAASAEEQGPPSRGVKILSVRSWVPGEEEGVGYRWHRDLRCFAHFPVQAKECPVGGSPEEAGGVGSRDHRGRRCFPPFPVHRQMIVREEGVQRRRRGLGAGSTEASAVLSIFPVHVRRCPGKGVRRLTTGSSQRLQTRGWVRQE